MNVIIMDVLFVGLLGVVGLQSMALGYSLIQLENAKKIGRTDGLTGLNNKIFFQNALKTEIKKANRLKYPISVLMIDSDYFKHYNDSEGHLKGDLLIQQMAKHIKDNIRHIDFAARFGGDEFAVILPGATKDDTIVIGERIRKDFESSKYLAKTGQQVTLSVGAATGEKFDKNLLNEADKALYISKQKGRNQVFHVLV